MTLLLALPVMMGFRVMSSHHTTGNPIGTRRLFKGNLIGNLMPASLPPQKLNKTKIGSVDVYLFSTGKIAVRVTGE